ncbi:MAG: RecX family transcriptional regulator [Chitinophagaceae bacterium]|nr:RecX family transcriptional regulator [Chitinophagaceae bacterium]
MIKKLTKEQALPKIKLYCAYQERCHKEVKEKLYSLGLYKKDVEQLISQMIEENYLNEERFAIQYAGGKFRMNKWGRIKIKHALRQKQVSDYSIKKALKEISETDYKKTLQKLAEQKLKTLKAEKNIFSKKKKLQDYLVQKGYEGELVREVVNERKQRVYLPRQLIL